MNTRLMFIHTLSPVHVGTGQSVGAIDLAIARDRATGFPVIPGSSIKGVLRDISLGVGTLDTVRIFGPETDRASDHAGAVSMGDANLLLLPVRSVYGTFAWSTSPWLLARFARDAVEAGFENIPTIPTLAGLESCLIHEHSTIDSDQRVFFEDLDLLGEPGVEYWADCLGGLLFSDDPFWRELLNGKLCIVHDDVMSFLATHAIDISARIRLEHERKTVADGGLWYEESLPAESILTSLVLAAPNRKTRLDSRQILDTVGGLLQSPIQLGGNATIGRGRCRAFLATA